MEQLRRRQGVEQELKLRTVSEALDAERRRCAYILSPSCSLGSITSKVCQCSGCMAGMAIFALGTLVQSNDSVVLVCMRREIQVLISKPAWRCCSKKTDNSGQHCVHRYSSLGDQLVTSN